MRMAIAKRPASCAPVLHRRLAKTDAASLAATLRALADPARLRLMSFIAAQPDGEACVCHLTGPVELSQPTVSHHLKVLNDAGLLEREKRGTWAYYRVVPDKIEALRAALVTTAPRRRRTARRA
jgi:ArsR family transcriptional regulator